MQIHAFFYMDPDPTVCFEGSWTILQKIKIIFFLINHVFFLTLDWGPILYIQQNIFVAQLKKILARFDPEKI